MTVTCLSLRQFGGEARLSISDGALVLDDMRVFFSTSLTGDVEDNKTAETAEEAEPKKNVKTNILRGCRGLRVID